MIYYEIMYYIVNLRSDHYYMYIYQRYKVRALYTYIILCAPSPSSCIWTILLYLAVTHERKLPQR